MLVLAVTSSVASVVLGLWLSWAWNIPSGAAIVLASAALFFAALALGSRQRV
jgi:ABC-type Mn2+/Zn2+ transport system permease subunit